MFANVLNAQHQYKNNVTKISGKHINYRSKNNYLPGLPIVWTLLLLLCLTVSDIHFHTYVVS